MLNRLTGDQMLAKTDPRFQKHLRDMQNQEILNVVASKFKEQPAILESELNEFILGLDPKYEITGKYALRALNRMISGHGFKIDVTTRFRVNSKITRKFGLIPILQSEIDTISS